MKRDARIKAMQLLYTMDFNNISIDEVISNISNEEYDFLAVELAKNCVNNLEKIDYIIKTSLQKYTIDRLNLVDKAIIRLAVSEMLGNEPRQVIINEALEITKQFSDQGDHKATAFNNRLLDNINKNLG